MPNNNLKSWHKFVFSTPAVLTEQCAAFLGGLSGSGVEIINGEGADDKIIMYLPADQGFAAGKIQLDAFLAGLPSSVSCEESVIYEEDWNRQWKRFFKPEKITGRLVIKPTWEPYTAAPGEFVIEMDPGRAFGTGHHASTRLMLSLIERIVPAAPVQRVLDIGTGTGILAMAAALFGAGSVLAVDNDPDAVDAARNNVLMNNLQEVVEVSGRDIADIGSTFELVLANLIYSALMGLAPVLAGKTAAGGFLALSGILTGDQERDIIRCYGSLGFTYVRCCHEDEWSALLFSRCAL